MSAEMHDRAENITSHRVLRGSQPPPSNQAWHGTIICRTPIRRVAASMAMLDHNARRPLIFGISPATPVDANCSPISSRPNEMFLEAINQVLDIWAVRTGVQFSPENTGTSRRKRP